MKRAGSLIDKITSLDNLALAAYKAFRGKQYKQTVINFRKTFLENIQELRTEIIEERIELGQYHKFTIFEPKERLICAAPLKQRIIHHAIMNVCHDIFDKNLIYDSYASRPLKGTHHAVKRVQAIMPGYSYFVKLDIRKYFDSINHGLLKMKLRLLFKDKRLLRIFDEIIDSYGEGQGLPIGNLTSQYFANYYLSSLDHHMKEIVGCKRYVRYMDDVIILAKSKSEVIDYKNDYVKYANQELSLQVKPPIIGKISNGIPFLGFKIFRNLILLAGKAKRRYRKTIRILNRLFEEKKIGELEYSHRIQSMVAYVAFADSYIFRKKVLDKCQ